jgi:glycosyltransferase involved in cell wall biosynthesis
MALVAGVRLVASSANAKAPFSFEAADAACVAQPFCGPSNQDAMMFSVVIPLYNKEQTIARAIRSVRNQTVQDWEIVVVDDGSTDGGPCVVEGIPDPRIRLIRQENQGVSGARNRGIAEARFDLIAFLDGDDEWKPTFLETVARLVRAFPEAAVFATSYLFAQNGRGAWAPKFRGMPAAPWDGILTDYFAVAARSDPPLWTSAVTVKKEAILGVGGFPRGIASGEDLLTWARLAVAYKTAFSSQSLSVFHLGVEAGPGVLRRQPSDEDMVGRELAHLLEAARASQKRSLRRYLAMWNKMRASILLRAGRRGQAMRHALAAAAMDPLYWRNPALLLFAILPRHVGRSLFHLALICRWRLKVRRS